jgi:ataxin-3
LNSVLSGPELISNTYLALFLTQLQQEGYAIFVIIGELPDCTGDQVLANTLVSQARKPHLLNQPNANSTLEELDPNERRDLEDALKASLADDQEDQQSLQIAIEMSMSECTNLPGPSGVSGPAPPTEIKDDDEDDLQKALQMSMDQFRQDSG